MATTFTLGADASASAPDQFADDAQTYDEPQRHNLTFWLERGIAGIFYDVDELGGKLSGIPQDAIDMRLLRQAEDYGPLTQGRTPDEMSRFRFVMEHFLSGRRNTLFFRMSQLLRTSAGARARVSEAISYRIKTRPDLVFGSPACDLPSHAYLSGGGRTAHYAIYQFPIRQGEYQDTDWQFALGTFTCMWQPIATPALRYEAGPLCRSKRGDDWNDRGTLTPTRHRASMPLDGLCNPALATRAKVWGSKIWRWHSETDRASKGAHQAAYRLVQSGKLFNFWVIAEPCIVDIGSGMPVGDE